LASAKHYFPNGAKLGAKHYFPNGAKLEDFHWDKVAWNIENMKG